MTNGEKINTLSYRRQIKRITYTEESEDKE